MGALEYLAGVQELLVLMAIILVCVYGAWQERHKDKKYVVGIDMSLMPSGLRYKQKIDWIRSHKKKGEMTNSRAQAILRDWEKRDQVHDLLKEAG